MKTSSPIFTIELKTEKDIIYVQQVVRELSSLAGLTLQAQSRFITAICEIANNALEYAGGGTICFHLVSDNGVHYKLQATVEDKGPGIDSAEQYVQTKSTDAKGKGLSTAKDLVHHFKIESTNTGTKVILEKNLAPDTIVTPENTANAWTLHLNTLKASSIIEELQVQNHHLVKALTEVEKVAQELADKQTRLSEHSDKLEKANLLKRNFVANMSHEMRTPLNAVIGISDILSKTALNKHQQFLVSSLDAAGKSLLSLINDILDLAKLEAGRFAVEIIDFSLIDTIKEALSVVQPQALEKYVDLLVYWGPSLPERVVGDPHRLQQVIINLVANAIKFSSQNAETDIFVFSNGYKNGVTSVRFVIFDTGIGISPTDQEKLFEAFSQLDTATNRKYPGSGLGLSICRHLVNLMKGDIGFYSKKDMGTAFWFEIPFDTEINLDSTFKKDLDNLEIIFSDNKLQSFELLVQALGVKYRRLDSSAQQEELKSSSSNKVIFIDQLPGEFASLRPSRLFNHLMERCDLPYRIENFRSGKEKFLLGRKLFLKKIANCGDALLVEDHSMNQLIGKLQLEELGFDVEVCGTGTDAIRAIIRKKFSIIFMDCQMPEMDGYEVTHQIRLLETQTSSRTPIIALTASALEGEKEKCLEAGMDDYLTKPVDAEVLYKICQKWLNHKENIKAPSAVEEHKNSTEINLIDRSKLNLFSNEQYCQLIKMYRDDSRRLLAELEIHLINKEAIAATAAAHTLNGASRMIYAKSLADNYKSLESALKLENWQTANNLLIEIKEQFKAVEDELSSLTGVLG